PAHARKWCVAGGRALEGGGPGCPVGVCDVRSAGAARGSGRRGGRSWRTGALDGPGIRSAHSPKEVSFISRGATGHHQRSPAVPENGFQQQAEPLFPNNAKAAREQRSGCCSSPQPKPHCSPPQLLLPQLLPSATDARLAGASEHMDSSGMGVQRFRDTLKTPYKLKLKTEPGKADLKHIVIDGSNVAIT
ncbi:NEDD4-binding protein 1, partial [Lemmus lemmus]